MNKIVMLSSLVASIIAALAMSASAIAGPVAFQEITYFSDAAHTVQVGRLEVIDCTGATRMSGVTSAYTEVATVNYAQCQPGSAM
jgi:predicted secreted protein